MLSLAEVLGVTGSRADVRVWLATGGVIDVELPAVNANLLTAGARVVVAFAGEGEDSGIVLGAIDGTAAAALGHAHGGGDITSAVASATNADTVDGQHAAAFAAASHSHTAANITDFSEATQDAVAAALVDSLSIEFEYVDSLNQIKARVADDSIVEGLIASNAVTNAKLEDMAHGTVKGREVGAGTGNPVDLTATQLVAIVATAGGADSGLDADLLDGQHASEFVAWADADEHVTNLIDDYMISTETVEFSAEIDGLHANVLGVRVLTTAERNALPATNGMLICNSTTGKFQGRVAGSWVDLH
jgi:hypothetical protein